MLHHWLAYWIPCIFDCMHTVAGLLCVQAAYWVLSSAVGLKITEDSRTHKSMLKRWYCLRRRGLELKGYVISTHESAGVLSVGSCWPSCTGSSLKSVSSITPDWTTLRYQARDEKCWLAQDARWGMKVEDQSMQLQRWQTLLVQSDQAYVSPSLKLQTTSKEDLMPLLLLTLSCTSYGAWTCC